MEKSDAGKNSFQVYFDNKINKLYEQHHATVGEVRLVSDIFRGCEVFVNGVTRPPLQDIRKLIIEHGGHFHSYKVPTTTHEVCDHYSHAQVNQILKSSQHPRYRQIKRVTAKWVVDSVAAGRRLSEVDFPPAGLSSSRFGNDITAYTISKGEHDRSESSPIVETTLQVNNQSNATKVQFAAHGDAYALQSVSSASDGSAPVLTAEVDGEKFLQEFYGRSRLHFLGTWKSRLPLLVEKLRGKEWVREHSGNQRIPLSRERLVIHLDMDCFFVSVLIRDKPALQQQAVVVAHSAANGYSDVSSCNYVARSYGIKNGMLMKHAYAKLKSFAEEHGLAALPQLTVLQYDFKAYEAVSTQIYTILYQFPGVLCIQPVSVDEVYLELDKESAEYLSFQTTNANQSYGIYVAETLRRRIIEATHCPCSAGVGPNMLLARLATQQAKPNNQFEIVKDSAAVYLIPLPVRTIPQVGWATAEKLKEHHIETCGDVQKSTKAMLQVCFACSLLLSSS